MISLGELKEADDSFRIHSSIKDDERIATICSLDCTQEHGVIFIKNKKYYHRLLEHFEKGFVIKTMGVVVQDSFFKEMNGLAEAEFLKKFRFYASVESIDLALSRFSKLFFDEANQKEKDLIDGRSSSSVQIHPSSFVAENVFLGKGVVIGADVIIHSGCVILASSKIGDGTVLYPNVVLYRNVSVGKNCIIHANTAIGSDGFGYNYHQGKHLKVWHFGGVVIEDNVEIGSNTSIDQGTFSPTIIGEGTKIDNQVHIAHNCKLGKGVVVCGKVGFAGSVTVGDYVVFGGAVNIAPNVVIGNYAQIGGMAGVTSDVPEKGIFGGHPARPLNEWLKSSAVLRRMASQRNGKSCNK